MSVVNDLLKSILKEISSVLNTDSQQDFELEMKLSKILCEHEDKLKALVIDPSDPDELLNIYLEDCDFWNTSKRRIMYSHKNGITYRGVHLLEDFDCSRKLYRSGITKTDHSNFVNLNRVTHFNRALGEAYFSEDRSRHASVARVNAAQVRENLRFRGIID